HWLCGYSLKVSKETVFHIEARAILEGLRVAWEKGYRQLEIECNNALLVESVLTGSATSSNLNMAADRMAKCTYDNQFGLKLFEDPPISVQEILQSDDDFLSKMRINEQSKNGQNSSDVGTRRSPISGQRDNFWQWTWRQHRDNKRRSHDEGHRDVGTRRRSLEAEEEVMSQRGEL
ncbi:hypothetical protein Gogos_009294, partial [Gossypium gossypioides]|nr:hypothetical protein [Gossypium gossypioides]